MAQDMHDKLRRLADMIAALLIHRLGTAKKGTEAVAEAEKKVGTVSLLLLQQIDWRGGGTFVFPTITSL